MNRPSDQLFELIHSLRKEEKRHFKLYAKKYSKSSNYLTLFDSIAQQETYDERALCERFEGSSFTERFSVAKEYLYSLILRSLRDMEPTTPEARVRKLVEDSSLLLERRLFTAAKKRIRKATELARSYDLTGEQFILSDLDGLLPDTDRAKLIVGLRTLLVDTEKIVALGEFAESLRVFSEAKGAVRTEEDANELHEIARNCPCDDPDTLHTFSAKLRYHFGWFKYYEVLDDDKNVTNELRAIVALFDNHPQHIQTQQLAYISIVMNLATRELAGGEPAAIPSYLERIRTLEANKPIKPYCELLLFRFAIMESLVRKDWDNIETLHNDLDDLLTRNAAEANSFGKDIRIEYRLLFAKAFFLQQRFDRALSEITHLLDLPSLQRYPYQENNVRVLLLIIHYELGNVSYLPYLIRSTYRALLRRDRLFEFETLVLSYLASLVRLKKQRDILPSFERLLQEIKLLSAQPIDRDFPWREFYLDWLEKKILSMRKEGKSAR